MIPRSLLVGLAAVGFLLSVTVIPGVFTIDEDNYLITVLSLRDGGVTVPGTEGLTPSSELIYFDPQGLSRQVTKTPVTSTAPPLYAPLALPFALLGWRGLVAMQTVSYLLATWLVFVYARRYSCAAHTPWLAAAAFALGGYAIEYAQGLWPHMLAVLLLVAAAYLAARTRDGGPLPLALLAGLAAGLAAGIRYQNVFVAGCIGLGIVLFSSKRIRASLFYGVGCALPLAISSLINQVRLDSWNPISKGKGYLSIGNAKRQSGMIEDTLAMGWSRLVDFTTRPPLTGTHHEAYLHPDSATGAYLIGSATKKAWLQSAPWIAIALLALAWVWLAWRRGRTEAGDATQPPKGQLRELRALGVIVFPVLGLFAVAGVYRTDGLCFNQRYFLELVPFVALAFAWSLDRFELDRRRLLLGALAGVAVAGLVLLGEPRGVVRTVALMRVPLAIAVLLVGAWLLARRHAGSTRAVTALTLLAGAAVGWALTVHVGDDLPASRFLRKYNADKQRQVAAALPTDRSPVALFAWGGNKDAVGPLQLDRDLVVLDAQNDGAASMSALIDDFHRVGRQVLILGPGFTRRTLQEGLAGHTTRVVQTSPLLLLEAVPPDQVPQDAGPPDAGTPDDGPPDAAAAGAEPVGPEPTEPADPDATSEAETAPAASEPAAPTDG